MPSSALILSSPCPQPQQETALLLRRGPGLTVFQLVNFGAEYIDLCLNATFRGPKGPKDKIDNFFSENEAREKALDELYRSDHDNLTKQHKKLRGYCRGLLKYANAKYVLYLLSPAFYSTFNIHVPSDRIQFLLSLLPSRCLSQ